MNNFFFTPFKNLPDLIVFSHLRWEFVFQRPQHLMTRLGKNRRILFVEEPIPYRSGELGLAHVFNPQSGITVVQPKISTIHQTGLLSEIVERVMKRNKTQSYMAWFYSPTFVDILSYINPMLIIYDCMDELSAFRGAPPELLENEQKLLKHADIVFTGGKSLYEAKSTKVQNIYCFPSSVDDKHFSQTLKWSRVPQDLSRFSKPIVGFYGVIDERIDLSLLESIAELLPSVIFAMIGPVVKIDPASLPKRENIVYLGQKSYKELPSYLASFEIAMMPFAQNEATRFISPTKTLEFMAAGKPIVSSPITDVVRDYKHVVEIADNPSSFAKSISKLLKEPWMKREKRLAKQKQIIQRTSWDKTVQYMDEKMMQALMNKSAGTDVIVAEPSSIPSLPWKIAYDAS